MYAMQMECLTDFNTMIVKQCLVSTGANAPASKFEIEIKILYILVILWSCEKSQICLFLNVLYSHLVRVFSVFRYARRILEVTVNDRLSAAALISFLMLKVRRLLGSFTYFNYG